MKTYYPYISDKPEKKYYIITKEGKKIYFGSSKYDDYTTHKDIKRLNNYISRHKKNEDWNDINTAGFWSRWYLWNKPTKKESYEDIIKRFGHKFN